MSPATGAVTTSELRLAYAQRKLRAFTRTIRELQSSEFPHPDSSDALKDLAAHFEERLRRATRVLPSDVAAVDETLAQVNVSLLHYTNLLGFILRSTNVRNNFETYFPLKRLVGQIIDTSARLITSSEWLFIPFTYPMNIDALPTYVLVGAPAPEAGNTLIVPLAGHEIGHSAWRKHVIEAQIRPTLTIQIAATLGANPVTRDNLLQKAFGRTVQSSFLVQEIYRLGVKQLEEVFCDFLGIGIFGEGYLWAFEYFIAPGGDSRSGNYPSGTARIKFIQFAAGELGIAVDPVLFANWRNPTLPPGLGADLLSITDAAVDGTTAELWKLAQQLLARCRVSPPDQGVAVRILQNFEKMVPDGGGATLAEITTAGWRFLRDHGGLPNATDDTNFDLLNELMLKSIEVSEYLLRVGDA